MLSSYMATRRVLASKRGRAFSLRGPLFVKLIRIIYLYVIVQEKDDEDEVMIIDKKNTIYLNQTYEWSRL